LGYSGRFLQVERIDNTKMHENVCLNKRAIAIAYIDLGLWTAFGENGYNGLINIKDAIPVSFMSQLFTSYILTIFKQQNVLS